jgi:hypothetical protein
MPCMAGTAGEWFDRRDEVKGYLSERRQGLRSLAAAQCGRDSRLLGAVYHLKDGVWLWHRGERLTPEESRREYLGNAANEYDTLVENGEDQAESWGVTLGTVSEEGFRFPDRSEPDPRVEKLSDLESMVRFYRASSLKEISRVDRELTGTFTSCPKCRLTYFIEYRSMIYATGKAAAERAARNVIVLPGRVIPEGKDPALASAPAYGLVNSWQATQWQLC